MVTRDVFAIVGSEHWPDGSEPRVKAMIRAAIEAYPPDMIISGGAAGVDTWAVEVARGMGVPCQEFPPNNRRWAPDGFKARNIVMARTCTRMLAIRSLTSTRYGSGWTADYAEKIGKPVVRLTT